jgi:tripartite-type tricarboxylate transporter receptor subunit TctC
MPRPVIRPSRTLIPVMALLVAACSEDGGTDASASASAESCYEGEVATFVVPYASGGYDLIARGMAPFLEKELGGTVVVVNQPGAGSLLAANNLFSAEPDGLTFGILPTDGLVGATLAEAEGVGFDLKKFTFVARVAVEPRLLMAAPPSGLESIDEVMAADGLQWATFGVGSPDNVDATVLPVVLGIDENVEIVAGFSGFDEILLVAARGDVDLHAGSLGSRIDAVRNGDLTPILVIGHERVDDLPDVPVIFDLEMAEPELAEPYVALQAGGRSIVAPPDLPENCLTELQEGLRTVLESQEFQDVIGASVDVPLSYTSAEDLLEIIDSALAAPDELVDLLRTAYNE